MWTEMQIRNAIQTNDMDVCKAVVTIYRKQTKSEQVDRSTHNTNGVGFNKIDAKFLTSIAEQIIRNKRMGRDNLLSPAQIKAARKVIVKYSKQLAKIANGKI